MVEETFTVVDAALPVELITSSPSNILRAEPTSTLFEQGRAHLVGHFADLESQLVTYDGSGDSPDRLDAMVFALAALSGGRSKKKTGNALSYPRGGGKVKRKRLGLKARIRAS